MTTRTKIDQMIKDHEKKGYAAEFHCDLDTLAQLQAINSASRENILTPPMTPGKPWKLMGRDLHVVEDRKMELTAVAKKAGK
jgi:predicted phage gp36 major capsid-like protein